MKISNNNILYIKTINFEINKFKQKKTIINILKKYIDKKAIQ